MAFTYERRIDALGGREPGKSDDWNDGYDEALKAAVEIGEDADEMIAELMDTLHAIIEPTGYRVLKSLVEDADTLLKRIEARRA